MSQVTFSAIISTLLILLLPPAVVEPIASALLGIFGIAEGQVGRYILNTYIPKVNILTMTPPKLFSVRSVT